MVFLLWKFLLFAEPEGDKDEQKENGKTEDEMETDEKETESK